ncbi:hypothetical protein HAX54_003171 [Datura stramonium]|uniref:ZF-HD dimerization-type domain-containing protein n=1 Tax=Datura stramonium TaxID=4076 RepID=A0ABS8WUE6_DATST|nr:hypothetical protein [Datura stramonium]
MELENHEEHVDGKEIIDAPPQMLSKPKPKYRECLKNHAVGIGGYAVDGCGEFMPAGTGYAVDGCGEFMPAGEDGTVDALKCAACNCHRNFHRKETPTTYHPNYYRTTPPTPYFHHIMPRQLPLALPSTSGGGGYREDQELDMCSPNNNTLPKRRFRTRFSQEHKDKMLTLAKKLGWRIQRQDEGVVQQMCNEIGIKRHVFKGTSELLGVIYGYVIDLDFENLKLATNRVSK